jgi:flagellar hook-associated protein 2
MTTESTSLRPKVDGLISGIKSSDIIDAFMDAERSSTRIIERNKEVFTARRDAVRTFNTRLLSAQLDLSTLRRPTTFEARAATSSNTTALHINSASTSAIPGNYSLNVLAVAKAHQLATVGQTSAEASFGTGTVSLQVGSNPASQINFSAGGSLTDIANAINTADLGINASIINDGTATPFRLVLKAEQSGTANTILATGTGGMASLFSGMTTLNAASDAQVRIGSVASGITITQSSNTFTDIVPGVNFEARDVANNISVNVTADNAGAKESVKKFVESFNSAASYLRDNSSYDSATKNAGVLISQSSLVNSMNRLKSILTGQVAGLSAPYNNLASIGITVNKEDGLLVLDEGELSDALSTNANAVRDIFSSSGKSTNPAVQFLGVTDKTSTASPHNVTITQVAKQAFLNTSDLAATTVIDDTNNKLDLLVNGSSYSVTLTNATYTTRASLASHVHSLVRAATGNTDAVTISLSGNKLDVRSDLYGSSQSIQINGTSTALNALGLMAETSFGVNVAGTINGTAATGNGRILTGASGTSADGLSVQVTSTVPVSDVTVTAVKGLGQLLGERFTAMTNNTTGAVSSLDKNLTTNIENATKNITRMDLLLEKKRARYESQFLAMEKMIASFNSQGNALTSFIDSLTPKKT